jgi:anti-anti-sigma factor
VLARLWFEQVDSLVVAHAEGEIDMSNAADIRHALARRTSNAARGLVLDLSGITYLDSSGIHVIFELREQLRHRGQGLALVVPPGATTGAVLRLAGVSGAVHVAATAEDALREVERAAGE